MKLKRILALLLVLVLTVSMMQVPVFADTTSANGHKQPSITVSAGSTFIKGSSFSFSVTSDMSGILSVSVGGLADMVVESQPIAANTPFA